MKIVFVHDYSMIFSWALNLDNMCIKARNESMEEIPDMFKKGSVMNFDYTKEPGRCLLDRNLSHEGRPLMSVITPYFNAGKYFKQTFNCIMNQTFPWFEWIIVNDGSTEEESLNVLEELVTLDDRIRMISQKNEGLSSARNAGVKVSTTDIIVPLDADDLIGPTYLEYLYWALYFCPQASWAYTDSCGFAGDEYLWKRPFSAMEMRKENLLVCTAAIRKKAIEAVDGYYSGEKYFNEDWHFWLRLLSKGMYPVHTSGYLFWYRRSNSGILKQVESDKKKRRKSLSLIHEAAKNVDEGLKAVEYPKDLLLNRFYALKSSSWDRSVFKERNKIRILMLIPWMVMGGADIFNLDVCARIDKEKYEIGIITTQPSENSWQQRFEEHVTDIFNLPEFLDTANWAEFISYYIKSREIDILFLSNSYYGYYLVPWLRKEFPQLAIIDYVHMEEWYWRNGGYARISGSMGEILEKTYVCNGGTRKVLIDDFGRGNESVETLYIGVDQDKFSANKVEYGKAKATLEIESGRPMVLFPCRIHPQKRPFLMLEIAKKVKDEIPDIAFAVVGDGPQFEELKTAIEREKLQKTIFLAGRQTDMLPWYKDCVLTLICSLKEGLALTAYESLSMGKPVITSDVGGQKELVDHTVGRVIPLMQDEESSLDAREFDQQEVELYVGAIKEILADDVMYREMCAACRDRIVKHFSSQIMIGKLEKIFTHLAESENKERERVSKDLRKYPHLIQEPAILYGEIEAFEGLFMNEETLNKSELVRLANSKWGRRAIKLMFKLKINKLFK